MSLRYCSAFYALALSFIYVIPVTTVWAQQAAQAPRATNPTPQVTRYHVDHFGLGMLVGFNSRRGLDEFFGVLAVSGIWGQGVGGSPVNTYGYSHGRLEIGNGFGGALAFTGGQNLVHGNGSMDSRLLAGFEPINFQMRANTNSDVRDHIFYTPSAALGGRFRIGNCVFTPVARGGVIVGSLRMDGGAAIGGGQFGAGFYLACTSVSAAIEASRAFFTMSGEDLGLNTANATALVTVRRGFSLGVRAEAMQVLRAAEIIRPFEITTRSADTNDLRGFLVFNFNIDQI